MYRKNFALTAFPFDLTLEPEDLFPSATLAEAAVRLKHLLELRRRLSMAVHESLTQRIVVRYHLASRKRENCRTT